MYSDDSEKDAHAAEENATSKFVFIVETSEASSTSSSDGARTVIRMMNTPVRKSVFTKANELQFEMLRRKKRSENLKRVRSSKNAEDVFDLP